MARKPLWTAADQKRKPKRLIIREKREAANLILGDVAHTLGLSPSQYSRYELNPHLLREPQLRKLAQLFGVSMGELTGFEGGKGTMAATRRVIPVYRVKGAEMLQVAELAPQMPVSTKSYAVEAPDDALRGGGDKDLRRGEWAIVDPHRQPAAGDLVHAVDPATGAHVLRVFVPLHPTNPRAPGALLRAATGATHDKIFVGADDSDAIKGVIVGKQVAW